MFPSSSIYSSLEFCPLQQLNSTQKREGKKDRLISIFNFSFFLLISWFLQFVFFFLDFLKSFHFSASQTLEFSQEETKDIWSKSKKEWKRKIQNGLSRIFIFGRKKHWWIGTMARFRMYISIRFHWWHMVCFTFWMVLLFGSILVYLGWLYVKSHSKPS